MIIKNQFRMHLNVPTNTKSEIRTNEEIIKLCIFEFQLKMVLGVDL